MPILFSKIRILSNNYQKNMQKIALTPLNMATRATAPEKVAQTSQKEPGSSSGQRFFEELFRY